MKNLFAAKPGETIDDFIQRMFGILDVKNEAFGTTEVIGQHNCVMFAVRNDKTIQECHEEWERKQRFWVYEHERGAILVDLKASIPAHANFYASDSKQIHKNRWRNPESLKKEFHWYYLIIAATFKLDNLPIISSDNIRVSMCCDFEIEWWLKDATGKTEMRVDIDGALLDKDGYVKPSVSQLYGTRLYRKLNLKYF